MSKGPKFQQRHYETLATLLQRRAAETETGAEYRDRLISDLADLFAGDNPNFNRGRFERATVPGANVRARA